MNELNYQLLDKKIFRSLHISYAVLISLISIYIIWENKERWPELLFWLSIFIFLEIYQHFAPDIPQRIFVILPIIEILTVIPLGLSTISAVAMWLILIVNIDAIIDMKTKYSLIFSVFSFVIYISIYIMKLGIENVASLIMIVFIAIVQYGIVMGMGFMAKNFYVQKNLYVDLLGKQKLQMLELEQLAIVKERNRMAGEIHDSVGHQLTTALVQLEAITMLMGDEDSKIKNRMIIVKDQVKEALEELRISVRSLRDDYYESFENKLVELKDRVEKITGIEIITEFSDLSLIPMKYRKTIYYIIVESITNGIKHGKCSKIIITLKAGKDKVIVGITNNGILPKKIVPGFGLTQIDENINELGGKLKYGVRKGEYFINAEFNISKGEM